MQLNSSIVDVVVPFIGRHMIVYMYTIYNFLYLFRCNTLCVKKCFKLINGTEWTLHRSIKIRQSGWILCLLFSPLIRASGWSRWVTCTVVGVYQSEVTLCWLFWVAVPVIFASNSLRFQLENWLYLLFLLLNEVVHRLRNCWTVGVKRKTVEEH